MELDRHGVDETTCNNTQREVKAGLNYVTMRTQRKAGKTMKEHQKTHKKTIMLKYVLKNIQETHGKSVRSTRVVGLVTNGKAKVINLLLPLLAKLDHERIVVLLF